MKTDIRPLHDQIAVRLVDKETVSAGGILIPETAQERPVFAEVLAVGAGALLKSGQRRPVSVAVGDKVLLDKRVAHGSFDNEEGARVLVVRESSVLGVVES